MVESRLLGTFYSIAIVCYDSANIFRQKNAYTWMSLKSQLCRVNSNDTQVEEFIGLDEELLGLMRTGSSMDEELRGLSIAAIVLGAVSSFFCFLILCAYGDYDKVSLEF